MPRIHAMPSALGIEQQPGLGKYTMPNRVKTAAFGCVLAGLSAFTVASLASPAAATGTTEFAEELRGIWFSDDDEGMERCAAYRKTMAADDGDASTYLVGAEVVSPDRWHSYADYGEGNVYAPLKAKKTGTGSWRYAVAVGIDADPFGEDAGSANFRASLVDGKLTWVIEDFDGVPVDSWDEHRYFKCAGVPDGIYGS